MARSRQSYTVKQLEAYSDSIESNGVAGAVQFYDDLYDDGDGYRYAGWAIGVARNDTVTGKSATDFMIDTAKEGVGGKPPKTLSAADINAIKKGMALGYADALIENAQRTGSTNQDVTYEQTRDFHKQVFEENGLSIDNWTLETPMKVIEGFEGKDAVEARWRTLRETGGDGPDGVYRSNGLYDRMIRVVNTPAITMTDKQVELQQQAREWLERVGPRATLDNAKKVWESLFGASQLGGSQQGQIIAISEPSFNYTSHKKDSVAGYTLVQVIDNAVDTAKHTTFNGVPAYLLAQTTQPSCQGDEAGIGGGVKSGTVGGEVKPTSASSSIFVEGKALVREGDTCTMNNGNTTGKYILV
ncbi:DUF4150 domain-containing protein [Psychrobacter celer]|uniref:DUF4150 domain-containing protein n=1 Tax=Psychrobacter celer TaxID=306572 RepID=UPI003FD2BADC